MHEDEAHLPAFGEPEPGRAYRDRPGAYGIIFDTAGRVACCDVGGRVFLPGGGLHGTESPAEALVREVREETGWVVEPIREVGRAVQVVWAQPENEGYRKIGTFFEARIVGTSDGKVEDDHDPVWLATFVATDRLEEEFQRWALRRALGR